MDHIKILVIATSIMEITRTQPANTKKYLKRFCDKTLFKKKWDETQNRRVEEGFPHLIDYHLKNINPMKICQVKDLKFMPTDAASLMQWYT